MGAYWSVLNGLKEFDYVTLSVYDTLLKQEVFATAQVLPDVTFKSIFPVVNREDSIVELKMEIDDDPTKENYYLINYYYNENFMQVADTGSPQIRLGSFNNNSDFYSDRQFPAGKLEVEKTLYFINPDDTIAISISNISEGYFKFLSARQRAGGIMASLANEPVNMPTNVTGGYGYFNLHYINLEIIDLSKW
jgi:hypothetical protein